MARFEFSEGALEVAAEGAGEAMLLLHAGTSNAGQWRRYGGLLGPGLRLYAVDLPGHGRSTLRRAPTVEGLFAGSVAALGELVEAVAPGERVHLVGHSVGGLMALLVAMRAPERVRSLCLFEPVAFDLLERLGPPEVAAECRAIARSCLEAVEAGEPALSMERFVGYWGGRGLWGLMGAAEQAAAIAGAEALHRVGIPATFAVMLPPELLAERLGGVPMVVAAGERSPAPARTIAEHLARVVPGAELRVIAGAGHMAPISHAAEFAAVVASLVARTRG